MINDKTKTKTIDLLNDYFDIDKPEKTIEFIKKNIKLKESIIRDIKEGKDRNFLLIEDWNIKRNYKVVLLRDVRRITFKFAEKISNSIFESEVTSEEWEKNDIKRSEVSESIIFIEAQMKSPYIEHLIQQLFHNFGRIGVEDMHKETIEELSVLTVNTFKL